jgi:hypothetical protein
MGGKKGGFSVGRVSNGTNEVNSSVSMRNSVLVMRTVSKSSEGIEKKCFEKWCIQKKSDDEEQSVDGNWVERQHETL